MPNWWAGIYHNKKRKESIVMPKVICNECKKEWSKEELKPHIENVSEKGNVRRYYLQCPYCKTKYICFYDDAKIESWQNLKAVTYDARLQHKLQLQIIDRMQMLKNKYGG